MQNYRKKIDKITSPLDSIAKPSTALILTGVLKGYIKYPLGFVLKSKIFFKNFGKQLNLIYQKILLIPQDL